MDRQWIFICALFILSPIYCADPPTEQQQTAKLSHTEHSLGKNHLTIYIHFDDQRNTVYRISAVGVTNVTGRSSFTPLTEPRRYDVLLKQKHTFGPIVVPQEAEYLRVSLRKFLSGKKPGGFFLQPLQPFHEINKRNRNLEAIITIERQFNKIKAGDSSGVRTHVFYEI